MNIAKHPVAFVAIIALALLLGWQIGRGSTPPTPGGQWMAGDSSRSGAEALAESVDLSLFWTAWETLAGTYIEPDKLQVQPLVYGAIAGLVDSLKDPYTVFMTPEQNVDFRSTLVGQLQGIGAELDLADGQIVVVAPLRGSPAEKAGLLPEDVITAVDGKTVEGMTLSEVVHAIRGPKGTTVTLMIQRVVLSEASPLPIVRGDIHIPSVESAVRSTSAGPVGVITLNQFGDATTPEFADALGALLSQNVMGLVIDERGNGGGYLEGATEIAAFFLPEGSLVVSVQRRDGERDEHDTKSPPLAPDLPLVVLVNQASASAAEILAGALQDHGRATVVGVKTYGKGTVQDVIDLSDGSSLKVTTARWLTPKGRDIGTDKIVPDLVVERTTEDFIAKRDPQLDAAVAALTNLPALIERGDEMIE